MIKNTILLLCSCIIISLISCESNSASQAENSEDITSKVVTTESGLKIEIIEQGQGAKPETGDFVNVHYTGRLVSNGEEFDSSKKSGKPFRFKIGVGEVIKGWDEGIASLNVGTSARLIIPANLGYGARDRGPIPANSDLEFDVELVSIERSPKKISFDLLDTNGIEPVMTNSGLKYFIVENGSGPEVEVGSKVLVHYVGYLKDGGKQFDNSYERGQPYPVTVGHGEVILGWDEGLMQLRQGDKAKLEIPPHLGYGAQGFPGVIPPDATLMFDVQIMKVQ